MLYDLYHRLRERFSTTALVLSVLALVFALAGGAYAASGALTGKQKKEVTKIAKQYAGKDGAAGATGPAGQAGAKGDTGAPGGAGSNGTNGATILSGTTVPAAGLGTNGDFYIRTTTSEIFGPKNAGAWGSGTALKGTNGTNGNTVLNGTVAPSNATGANGDFYVDTVANKIYGPKAAGAWPGSGTSLKGPPGEVNTEGPLPVSKTETGGWAVGPAKVKKSGFFEPPTNVARTAISFPIPLASNLGEAKVQSNLPGYNGEDEIGAAHEHCPGTAANPKAESGFLCVYATQTTGLPIVMSLGNTAEPSIFSGSGASAAGAVINIPSGAANEPEEVFGWGSWAVTG